jgi:hypothetical protein
MKILLLLLISFSSFSQITVKQARWCINNYDENFKLKEIIVVYDSILQKDSLQIVEYKKILKKYQEDSRPESACRSVGSGNSKQSKGWNYDICQIT